MDVLWIDFGLFLVLFGLFLYVFFRNTITAIHKVYLTFHFLMMIWPFCQFAISTITDASFQLFYLKLSFVGLSLLGEGWLIFTLFLTGQSYYLNRRTGIYLSLPVFLCVLGVIINPSGEFVQPVNGQYMDRDYGSIFWIIISTDFVYAAFSFYHLIHTLRSNVAPRHRQQVRMAVMGLIVLTAFGLSDMLINVLFQEWLPVIHGITSVGIVVSDIFFVIAIMRLRVFEVVQIARTNVIDSMYTGVIVMDEHDVVLEINKVIRSLLNIRAGDRMMMESFLAPYQAEGDTSPFLRAYRSDPPEPAQIEVFLGHERFRHASIQTVPLFDGRMKLIGKVLTFQNVSELRLLVEASHRQNAILQDRNRALIKMQDELFQANQKLQQMAITDSLTGCYNRRYLMQQLEHEVMTNRRYKIPFAIFLFDIDLFKSINDTYGHLVGDEVIRNTADVVRNFLRRTDILARYGGEEFTVYLPHTNQVQAEMLAERIKEAVGNNKISTGSDETVAITISMGVLSVDTDEATAIDNPKTYLKDLFSRVDTALYEAKHGGRNQVVNAKLSK